VVCGSASTLQKTYPEWDRKVLEHTYDMVDYVSLHRYYENEGNDLDFLASFVDMDNFINTITGTVDYVKALKRSNKIINLSFDEWNVWYQRKQIRHDWQEAPDILEDRYSLLDALVFAGMGMTLINHADRVKIACLAQLVNVIAPIFTEKGGRVIKQTTFYPFYDLSTYGRGTVLKSVADIPQIETKYGNTPMVATSVVHDEENDIVTVFALNINQRESTLLNIDMRSFGTSTMIYHTCLCGDNKNAINTFDAPDTVKPRNMPVQKNDAEKFEIELPKESWNVLRFKVRR
jgi:alpha-N-arabinofuranosidase